MTSKYKRKLPDFKYFHNNKSKTLDIVLHGGSHDMDSFFMKKVINVCWVKGNSVLAFNFPYIDRGEETASGDDLKEELDALKMAMEFCKTDNYKFIRLVGKSLGAVVAGRYLTSITENEQKKFSLIVLGYATDWIDIIDFSGEVSIIQGEKDKFGDMEKVKVHLKDAKSRNIKFYEIKGADHSYRDPKTKEFKHLDTALRILSSIK